VDVGLSWSDIDVLDVPFYCSFDIEELLDIQTLCGLSPCSRHTAYIPDRPQS